MTLRTSYPIGLWATTTLAMLAVLLGGDLPLLSWFAITTPALAALRLRRGSPYPVATVGTLIAAGGCVGATMMVVTQGIASMVPAAGFALLTALAGRLYSRTTLRHDLQALLLSLLLLFAGAGLQTSITYGLVLLGFALAAAFTLAARQLWAVAEREATLTGGISLSVTLDRRDVVTPRFVLIISCATLAVLLSTSIIFVLFPRIGLGTMGLLSHQRHAMPDGVMLSSEPRVLGGSGVVARVSGLHVDAFDRGLYLRVATYDTLTPSGFLPRAASSTRPRLPLARTGRETNYDVFLQPVSPRALPALGAVGKVEVAATGGQGLLMHTLAVVLRDGSAWASTPLTGPVRYRVYGELASAADADRYLHNPSPSSDEPTIQAAQLRPYLELPTSLDVRIAALARDVVVGAVDPADKARRLRRFLKQGFTYSLTQSNSGQTDPLASFLFDDRRGHCEFFATAYATMLRTVGVPARVVGGFAGGVWDERDDIAVFTAASAHAWTEWYQTGAGWVTDDATPVSQGGGAVFAGLAAWIERLSRAWDDNVLDYGLDRQYALWRQAANAFNRSEALVPHSEWPKAALALPLGILLMTMAVILMRRQACLSPAEKLAQALADACSRWLGRAPLASETLRGVVALVRHRAPPQCGTMLALALTRYENARFGRKPMHAGELAFWRRQLRRHPGVR